MVDICIVGGGVAGLMLAHCLPSSLSIAVLTKEDSVSSNTALAQGGIAASIGATDFYTAHAADTIFAGANHSNAERVEVLVREGQQLMEQLLAQGLPVDLDETGQPLLGHEGAHSMRRILHAGGDQTGKKLMEYLLEKTEQRITRIPYTTVLELLVTDGECQGVCLEDDEGNRTVLQAHHTVLATGGIGQLYSQTSNASVASGDGLSLAYHAGAVLEDVEFIQFHPTILTLHGQSHGLISEAVRGEAARLVNIHGQRIMEHVHPAMELAPRDIVARAIERHWQQQGAVFLDARHIDAFSSRFPTIYQLCQNHQLNPESHLIPVRPGAHFHMGGIQTTDCGATSIPRLYAIGEVASTGVHGANRLASNSLLEGLVFATRLANVLQTSVYTHPAMTVKLHAPTKNFSLPVDMQRRMTEQVGILREQTELSRFTTDYPLRPFDLQLYSSQSIKEIHRYTASALIAKAAFLRKESRGAHFRTDCPEPSENWTGKTIELSLNGVTIGTRQLKQKETMT